MPAYLPAPKAAAQQTQLVITGTAAHFGSSTDDDHGQLSPAHTVIRTIGEQATIRIVFVVRAERGNPRVEIFRKVARHLQSSKGIRQSVFIGMELRILIPISPIKIR